MPVKSLKKLGQDSIRYPRPATPSRQKSLDAFELYSYQFKIGNGIPQILKERPKKAFKRSLKEMLLDILETEEFYIDVDTITVKMNK